MTVDRCRRSFRRKSPFWGRESAPAFVRAPQGNGCAERFIRTLKENLWWLTTCDTVEELRLAVVAFKQHYNATWLIGRHGDKTPSQVRQEQLAALAEQAA
jgi:putative transposase